MKKLTIALLTLAITLNFFGCNRLKKLGQTESVKTKPEATKPKATKPKATKPKATKPEAKKSVLKKLKAKKSKAEAAKKQALLDESCKQEKKEGVLDCFIHGICHYSRFCQPEGDCKDGKDNDDDGLIDCKDGDCSQERHCVAKNFELVMLKPIKELEKPMNVASIKAEAQQMLNDELINQRNWHKNDLQKCKEGRGVYQPTHCFMDPRGCNKVIRKCTVYTNESILAEAVYLRPRKVKGKDLISFKNDLRLALVFQFYYDLVGQKLCTTMKELNSVKKLYKLSQNAVANAKNYYAALKLINAKVKLLKQRPLRNLPIPPLGVCKQLANGKFVWRYNTTPSYLMR